MYGIERFFLTQCSYDPRVQTNEHHCRLLCVGALEEPTRQRPFRTMTNQMFSLSDHHTDFFTLFYDRWSVRLLLASYQKVDVVVCSPDVVMGTPTLPLTDLYSPWWPLLAAAALEDILWRINHSLRTSMACVLARPLWLSGTESHLKLMRSVAWWFREWFSEAEQARRVIVNETESALTLFLSPAFRRKSQKVALFANVSRYALHTRQFGTVNVSQRMRAFETALIRSCGAQALHKSEQQSDVQGASLNQPSWFISPHAVNDPREAEQVLQKIKMFIEAHESMAPR